MAIKIANIIKGANKMKSEIINCECGEFIGIKTDRGFMIGDLIVKELKGICGQCGKSVMVSTKKIIHKGHEPLYQWVAKYSNFL